MGPDDLRYEMIRDIVGIISDTNGDEDDAREGLEAPIYTHELTGWLASRNDRYGYCDEFVSQFGIESIDRDDSGSIMTTLLTGGYMMELEEVFGNVWAALAEMADEDADIFDNTHDADCPYWQGAAENIEGCTCEPRGLPRESEDA